MRAAVLEELEKMVVREVETPKCDEDSVLVKVKACAICAVSYTHLDVYKRQGSYRQK